MFRGSLPVHLQAFKYWHLYVVVPVARRIGMGTYRGTKVLPLDSQSTVGNRPQFTVEPMSRDSRLPWQEGPSMGHEKRAIAGHIILE